MDLVWLVAVTLGWITAYAQQESIPTLSPEQVVQRLKDTSVLLLDVRTPEEFAEGHLPGGYLLPVQELERRIKELEPYRDKTIIVYCRSGNRSARATALLQRHRFRAYNMSGGIREWQRRGFPTLIPKGQR